MYQHSMNAPDEMRQLHNQFYQYINSNSSRKLYDLIAVHLFSAKKANKRLPFCLQEVQFVV